MVDRGDLYLYYYIMKGQNLISVLEFLKDGTERTTDFLEAFLFSGCSTSLFQRRFYQLTKQRQIKSDRLRTEKREKSKLRYFLNKLESDGLLMSENRNNIKAWKITGLGVKKLDGLISSQLPLKDYEKIPSKTEIILIFDIPENLKSKRNWLRSALKNIGFRMVQKSVWSGKNRIPKLFLKDLERLALLQYIDIFWVLKRS